MEKNINDLSVEELKAIAYDLIVARENSTSQLNTVNQIIAQRLKGDSQEVEESEEVAEGSIQDAEVVSKD